jgi:uroporphyrinogen decarboxylase
MDMALEPAFAHRIYDRMVEFELEYYERLLQAGDGQIDILRPHDDYGTQISLLFSPDMWRTFFKENTKKLTDLAHRYRACFMQHSCGAVGPIIPELIDCGVDILEPIQKVPGLEPDFLKRAYGDRLAFHGGIDTQSILPFGTVEDVRRETRRYIDTLNVNGGYILMASQGFEGDVPIENIEALYAER